MKEPGNKRINFDVALYWDEWSSRSVQEQFFISFHTAALSVFPPEFSGLQQ
jgi:hypothetical protein